MIIKQQLVKSRQAIYPGVNNRKYITIHETANRKVGAGAQAHANLQSNGFSASWHWQVDDKMAIQSYLHTAQCWHAGDGRGVGNLQSIAIEICVNEDSDYQIAVNHALILVRKIMKEEGISVDNVVQHHHWSKKDCPYVLRSGKTGISWVTFKQQLLSDEVSKVVKFGSKEALVKKLQRDLTKLGYPLIEDGSFGPATNQAVKFFQSMHGLAVTGSVGDETQSMIERLLLVGTSSFIRVLRYGSKGEAVGQLQRSLTELGYPLVIDHSFGPATRLAVQQFQKTSRLDVDGSVGPLTWEALRTAIFN